jgi:hypothetical protein
MIRKHIDKGLIALGCMLMVASFFVFSTAKRDGQNFRNLVAQIKFLKNTVQTKMTGSVVWFTGEEEEKINAFGLGLTGKGSSARYLYLNKIQIISLDDSLIEFLPDEELKLTKGSAMVLNPDGKLKMSNKNGEPAVVKEGMLYTSTDKGLVSTPAKFKKAWVSEGDPYSVVYKDNVVTELFLLVPPTLAIDRFGTSCIGKLQPINGDTGDVAYEVRAGTKALTLTGLEVALPAAKSDIGVRSLANGVSSLWREVQLPAHCITEFEEAPIPEPPPKEDLEFFDLKKEQVFVEEGKVHRVLVSFDVATDAELEVIGSDLDRRATIRGKFKREYRLSQGTYSFRLTQPGRVLNRIIVVKLKPFKIKDAIFIEEQN